MNYRTITLLLIILNIVIPASAAVYRVDNQIADGLRPGVLTVKLSNSTDSNDASNIYFNGKCNSDCTNINLL